MLFANLLRALFGDQIFVIFKSNNSNVCFGQDQIIKF